MPTTTHPPAVEYPDSDGELVAENTLQFQWIVALQGNLDVLFRERDDVFVAGDHLIYPVEGDNATRQAPDVYVAFGRPKGHRGSYRVWEEGGVFPQVVFEVLSPGTGERFLTFVELGERAEAAERRAGAESWRAEQEQRRAEHEFRRAEGERQKAERLAAKLRELGVDPDAV